MSGETVGGAMGFFMIGIGSDVVGGSSKGFPMEIWGWFVVDKVER